MHKIFSTTNKTMTTHWLTMITLQGLHKSQKHWFICAVLIAYHLSNLFNFFFYFFPLLGARTDLDVLIAILFLDWSSQRTRFWAFSYSRILTSSLRSIVSRCEQQCDVCSSFILEMSTGDKNWLTLFFLLTNFLLSFFVNFVAFLFSFSLSIVIGFH